jgi:hypothetical protein
MSDHVVELGDFTGDADLSQNIPIDGLISQVNLFGQLVFRDKTIRYTVSSPINIDHGKVIRWDLDREKLDQFLKAVLQNPLTLKVLATEPTPILNLWYAETSDQFPDTPYSVYGSTPIISYDLPSCPSLYSGSAFPSAGNPLRGFGFNQPNYPRAFQFLLVGKEVVAVSLTLSPYDGSQKNFLNALTPKELQIDGHPAIGMIQSSNGASFPDPIVIWVKWDPETATPEDIEAYRQKILTSAHPFVEIKNGYVLVDSVFWISADGSVEIKSCH